MDIPGDSIALVAYPRPFIIAEPISTDTGLQPVQTSRISKMSKVLYVSNVELSMITLSLHVLLFCIVQYFWKHIGRFCLEGFF